MKPWYTHRLIDGEHWVLNYPPSIPFLWQYDKDANAQLGSTAFFPDYYRLQPLLTDRPLIHGLGYAIGRVVYPFVGWATGLPFSADLAQKGLGLIERSDLRALFPEMESDPEVRLALLNNYISGAAGLVIFKLLFFFLGGLALFHLARQFSTDAVALFSVGYLFTNGYLVNAIGTYHTYEFQVLSPIIICFLFHQLCRNYSVTRNIGFSLIVGLLMMGKANYAAYIAVLAYALIFLQNRRLVLGAVLLSIVSHSIPWMLWHFFLELKGIGLFHLFSTSSSTVVAPPLHPLSLILSDFLTSNAYRGESGLEAGLPAGGGATLLQGAGYSFSIPGFITGLKIVSTKIGSTLRVYGTLPGFLAIASICIITERGKFFPVWRLLALLILGALVQATIAFPMLWHDRFVFDPIFVIYFLASVSIFGLIGHYSRSRTILFLFLLTMLLVSILDRAKIPWIHPFDQTGFYSKTVDYSILHVDRVMTS